LIEVNNLIKKYGEHLAVDDLSFSVGKGQILGFLGPNGAGKSTTMNILTGYISATEGSVLINGHDIFLEPEEAKKCIGYLPEIPPLYQDMTEISAICHKVMIINKGKLIVSDTPENLSKHIGGSNGLHLEVKGNAETIKEALSGIKEITRIDTDNKHGAYVKVSIYSAEENDIREEVFYSLSSAKCPIMDMQSSRMSLEDIFLELTQSGEEKSSKKGTKKNKLSISLPGKSESESKEDK